MAVTNQAYAEVVARNSALEVAAKIALSYVEKELLPLHAKMSTLTGPALAIYEDSPVYKGLIAKRDAIKSALQS